jgi:hypothetical protein
MALRKVAALALGLVASVATRTAAGEGHVRPAPPSLSAAVKPAGVPADYVLTHHGWFHRSCVVVVGNDEVVGADRVVRGMDGTTHFAFAPCAHPRYDHRGNSVPANPEGSGTPTLEPVAVTYDGYIVYYSYDGNVAMGPTLNTAWIVPAAPTDVANQDIAFFNDILTSAGGGDILQPVLDFNGEVRGKWAVESEHCCISGNDEQTTPIVVLPGDQISGTVVGTGCASTGVCQAWTVTTADVTSGKSTTLNTTAPMGVPNGASPGSLETYGVSSCDMFPASGETTFTGNRLTDSMGAVQSVKYRLLTLDMVAAEVPRDCGYGGSTSGNNYTLIYGALPVGPDAGTSGGGTAGGGASGAGGGGGAGGTSAGGASGHDGGGGGTSGTGGGGGGAAGTLGGLGGSGGSSGTAGSSGTGGARSASDAAASSPDGSPSGSSNGGGCSCSTSAGADPFSTSGFLMLALTLSTTALRRRRRAMK